ncbi:MAG: hypothetical protein ACD_2C00010G0008 [uncultured bacterium (gcode 4)]|uniref:YdhG-like domain-containing protein n=1 Tax=uncultured bacterium (gcode 4) TaxID=1234023 RepID=K2H366_9BACT|nr:MAG: hypothetical protein ACD_2C00010G0008 [uncultured bacterium (gcode 4)]
METYSNIDEYIEAQEPDKRFALEKIRQIIRDTVPEAQEKISYSMPAFKFHWMLVGFAAAKNHYWFYPWDWSTIEKFKDELTGYKTSVWTIQFPIWETLPVELIKIIVEHRANENIIKESEKKKKRA